MRAPRRRAVHVRTPRCRLRRALHQARVARVRGAVDAVFVSCAARPPLIALRDECRHVTTMMLPSAARGAGNRTTREPRWRAGGSHDVFFLTCDEMPRVLIERDGPWRLQAADRRRERERIGGCRRRRRRRTTHRDGIEGAADVPCDNELRGYGVSSGTVTGASGVAIGGGDRISVRRDRRDSGDRADPHADLSLVGDSSPRWRLLSHADILAHEYDCPPSSACPMPRDASGTGMGRVDGAPADPRAGSAPGDASRRPASVGPVGRTAPASSAATPAGAGRARRDDHAERPRR